MVHARQHILLQFVQEYESSALDVLDRKGPRIHEIIVREFWKRYHVYAQVRGL